MQCGAIMNTVCGLAELFFSAEFIVPHSETNLIHIVHCAPFHNPARGGGGGGGGGGGVRSKVSKGVCVCVCVFV